MHLVAALALTAAVLPVHASGELTSYDPVLAPEGAEAAVVAWPTPGGGTAVLLRTTGLLPNRQYGAHAHAKPCGPNAATPGRTTRTSKTR